jgi:N-acetylglutamate synthase-like GNAT family acetyltransferase
MLVVGRMNFSARTGFFSCIGFKPTSRAEVSAAAQQSVEFTNTCPVSAQAMVLSLKEGPASS